MAEDGEDAQGNVVHERGEILQLQSDLFRRQEQLERLQHRCRALEEELRTRETDLEHMRNLKEAEQKTRAGRGGEDQAARAASAEDSYMREQVRRLLCERVPAMGGPRDEDQEEDGTMDNRPAKGEDGAQKKEHHDTVLVSYVQDQNDYKVSYRIDSHTTAEQLHRDACAYWGCSRKDYSLYKVDKGETPTEIYKLPRAGEPARQQKHLQDPEILNPAEQAHLHLCREKEKEEIVRARQKEKDRESKVREKQQAGGSSGGEEASKPKRWDVLRTMRYDLGLAVAERQPEEFVDALKQWPGVYHLLRTRNRGSRQKWHPVRFSDLVIFSLMILLSALCVSYRNELNYYLLRDGAYRALARGVPRESSRADAAGAPLRLVQDAWGAAHGWEALAPPGAVELAHGGSLRYNGSAWSARTAQPAPTSARGVRLQAIVAPAADAAACSRLWVTLSPAGADAPPVARAAWGCGSAELVAPLLAGGTGVASACALPADAPYSLEVEFGADGLLRLNAGAGCQVNATSAGGWGTVEDRVGDSDRRPLFLHLGGNGSGVLDGATANATGAEAGISFESIRRYEDIWDWLGGSFHYQVFDARSTLRGHYAPVGFLRLRQQRAASRECPRKVAYDLRRPCHEIRVGPGTQMQEDLPPDPSPEGQAVGDEARKWHEATPGQRALSGRVQPSYDGAGYSMDLGLGPNGKRLAASGRRLTEALPALRDIWVAAGSTRFLALELVLTNLALGGYVYCNLLLEIAPSGAVHPSLEMLPLRLAQGTGDEVADGLDIARWVIAILFLAIIRVWLETKRQVLLGRKGLAYFVSFPGIVDMATLAAFFALQYMRLKPPPQRPEDLQAFHSYSMAAWTADRLYILESLLLLLLILRFATFMRIFPAVYRAFHTFAKSVWRFVFFAAIFLPVLLGNVFLANAIYSPHLQQFSTWPETFTSVVWAMQETFDDLGAMSETSIWTVPFVVYFFVSMVAFFLNGFLAITVHSYFEVELIDGSDPRVDNWGWEQWLQWMLWSPVYRWITKGAGASSQAGDQDGEQEDDSESSDEDENEEKRP